MSKFWDWMDKSWLVKAQRWLSKNIAFDKWLHLIAGIAIAGFLGWSVVSSLVLVIVAGVGKELYDKFIKKTKFDWIDLAYTVGGGLIGLLKYL